MALSKYSILEQLFQVLKNMIFELPSFFTLQKSIDKRLVQDIVKISGDYEYILFSQIELSNKTTPIASFLQHKSKIAILEN